MFKRRRHNQHIPLLVVAVDIDGERTQTAEKIIFFIIVVLIYFIIIANGTASRSGGIVAMSGRLTEDKFVNKS
jgi:hypothetical protein